MQNKKYFTNILFIITSLILVIGALQILLYVPGQIEIMNNAASQGVSGQEISKYFWQEVMLQILTYLMFTIGFMFTLLSFRMLLLKFNDLTFKQAEVECESINTTNYQEDEDDEFLHDFEIISENMQ